MELLMRKYNLQTPSSRIYLAVASMGNYMFNDIKSNDRGDK
jgi:hypothetical protein